MFSNTRGMNEKSIFKILKIVNLKTAQPPYSKREKEILSVKIAKGRTAQGSNN